MEIAAVEQPEQTVFRIASRLIAVQHAVAKMTGGTKVDADPYALEQAVFQIRAILRKIDGAYGVIIGGLAVQQHGYVRYTEDVDVVVDDAHFGEVLAKMREAGFAIMENFSLKNSVTDVKVDLLREGNTLKNSRFPLPHPSELGQNGWFATLPALVRLKIDASRSQDEADIINIFKRQIENAPVVRAELSPAYLAQFDAWIDRARRELA